MRVCNKCHTEKEETKFENNRKTCRKCRSRVFYENNTEAVKERSRNYYHKNKEQRFKSNTLYVKNRKLIDPAFKLRMSVSGAVYEQLKKNKNKLSTFKYLPYTPEELRNHLESLFEDWMTWDNFGIYRKDTWDDNDKSTWTWHVDHIIPKCAFEFTSMEDEEFQKCWALKNLRPLSAKQNVLDNCRKYRLF